MTIQGIFIFSIIFIGISVFVIAKKKYKVLSISFLVLCISIGIGVLAINTVVSQSEYSDWFRNLKIENITINDDLSIKDIEGKKVLYNNTIKEELNYSNFSFDSFMPVYLSKTNGFYVVVFSKDSNKTYDDERFYQGDYERFRQVDFIAFIDTEHGYIHALRDVELFGRSIDLSSFMSNNTALVYKIFHHYSEKTFAYGFATFLYSDRSSILFSIIPTLDVGAFFYPMTSVHDVEGAIHDNVTHLVFGEDDTMVFTTDEGVIGISISINVSYRDGLITGYGYNSDLLSSLDGLIYLQQGYYTEVNNIIYYVDNDMNLKRLGSSQIIGNITDLELWTNSIPV